MRLRFVYIITLLGFLRILFEGLIIEFLKRGCLRLTDSKMYHSCINHYQGGSDDMGISFLLAIFLISSVAAFFSDIISLVIKKRKSNLKEDKFNPQTSDIFLK